jgi:hypothetical protein
MANARVILIFALLSILPLVICKVIVSQTLETSDDHLSAGLEVDDFVPIRRLSQLVKALVLLLKQSLLRGTIEK